MKLKVHLQRGYTISCVIKHEAREAKCSQFLMEPHLQRSGLSTWTFKFNEHDSPSTEQTDTVRNAGHSWHLELPVDEVVFVTICPPLDGTFNANLQGLSGHRDRRSLYGSDSTYSATKG